LKVVGDRVAEPRLKIAATAAAAAAATPTAPHQ